MILSLLPARLRARTTVLVAAWGLLSATPAAAQRASEADTTRPVTIFSDMLGGRGEYATVVLVGRTAYRVEITPATASFAIRPLRVGSARPPMVSSPFLGDPAEAGGGRSYLVVPAESGEYRLEVASSEPVRVRVVRDPREQALLDGRMQSALRKLTFGLSAVTLGRLELPLDTVTGATGWQFCLGMEPGRIPFARRLGGCALTFSRFDVPHGGVMIIYGIAPRYEVVRLGPSALALAADIGVVGKLTYQGVSRQTYETFAFGVDLWLRKPGFPVALQVAPAVVMVHRDGYRYFLTDIPGESQTTSRLAVGVHARF